jgi:acyl dehydratase
MRIFKDFDELKAAVGTEVGVSDWIEVTQERIDQFARATGDDQWIHVVVERAERELPTGTTIAHGLLTLSFAPVFVRSVIDLEGLKNTLNYGANRIRYLAPVPAGSRLRGRIAIAAAERAPRNGLRVTYGVTVEIESHGRPACVAELIAVHFR